MWHDAFAHRGPCGEMDFDEGFLEDPMTEQLGKIVDSVGNPVPRQWVLTDDGYEVALTATEAQTILNSIAKVPLQGRLAYIKQLQSSKGIMRAIETVRRLIMESEYEE